MITDISDKDIQFCGQLDKGDFVEVRGIAEPPIVEAWIDRVEQLFGFLERHARTILSSSGKKGKVGQT